jgi:hypothetical protein
MNVDQMAVIKLNQIYQNQSIERLMPEVTRECKEDIIRINDITDIPDTPRSVNFHRLPVSTIKQERSLIKINADNFVKLT